MDLTRAFHHLLSDPVRFAQYASGLRLRRYQQEVVRAIWDSIRKRRGLTFVVMFPRQSGKNEIQAQLEAYLLTVFSPRAVDMVKVSPTFQPQALNAMRRLERVLSHNLVTRHLWRKEGANIYRVGRAAITFLSAEPTAHIVGQTASLLLECDEAQEVSLEKWDKEILPMAASTHATCVLYGTAWTVQTLLAREKQRALQSEAADGVRRLFLITADEVRREAPAYGRFVDEQVARLGRTHPLIRTQYFAEEIEAESGFFTAARLAQMQGEHNAQEAPLAGHAYLFCLDVGGATLTGSAFAAAENPPEHDATCLTVFEVDDSQAHAPAFQGVTYRTVQRHKWVGVAQPQLVSELQALIRLWMPRRVIVDASGLGEGLAAFLERAFPGRIIPFKFTQSSKSRLGWAFMALVEGGRYREYAQGSPQALAYQDEFFAQARACLLEALPGPAGAIRWYVPASARHPLNGQPLHDDWVISAALVALADELSWGQAESAVIAPSDPLESLRF